MPKRLASGLIAAAVLSLATYLLTVPMWRYAVVEGDLFAETPFAQGFAGWRRADEGVFLHGEGGTLACLEPGQGAAVPYLAAAVSVRPDFDHVLLHAEVMGEGLVAGPQPWQVGRLDLWSFDSKGRIKPYWPRHAATLTGDRDWHSARLVVPVGSGTVGSLQQVAYHGGSAGKLCLRALSVQGLIERRAFKVARFLLWGAWFGVLCWGGIVLWRSSASGLAKAAIAVLSLAILVMLLLPQPHYARFTYHLEDFARVQFSAARELWPAPDRQATELGSNDEVQPPSMPRKQEAEVLSEPDRDTAPELTWASEARRWLRRFISLENLAHAAAFGLLGLVAGIAFPHTPGAVRLTALLVTVVASEALQLMLITRSSQWLDIAADGLGVTAGLGLAVAWRSVLRLGRAQPG